MSIPALKHRDPRLSPRASIGTRIWSESFFDRVNLHESSFAQALELWRAGSSQGTQRPGDCWQKYLGQKDGDRRAAASLHFGYRTKQAMGGRSFFLHFW